MKTQTAIKHFGGAAKVADLLKISRQAVHQWPDTVPLKSANKLAKLSDGALDLRLKDYL